MIVGGVIALFGVLATIVSFNTGSAAWGGESARLFPLAVSIGIMLMGTMLMVAAVRKNGTPIDLGGEVKSVLALAVLGCAYVFAISKVGYFVATGLAAPVALLIFGVRSPIGLAVSVVLCPLVYHLVFFVALGVFPPYGEWFDLLDVIQGG